MHVFFLQNLMHIIDKIYQNFFYAFVVHTLIEQQNSAN